MKEVIRFCPFCGEIQKVRMTDEEYKRYKRWVNGEGLLQHIGLDADRREILNTGICNRCFDNNFLEDRIYNDEDL